MSNSGKIQETVIYKLKQASHPAFALKTNQRRLDVTETALTCENS